METNIKKMSCSIDDEKLLEQHKIIWTKTGDLNHFELNDLPICDER